MWADGGEEDGRDVRVNEGSASRERVCGAASGGGEDASISLNNGQKFIIAVKFEIGDVWGWTTVNNEFCD